MADIFISYAREDIRIARDTARRLSTEGYDVWWDHELLAGDEFRRVIQKQLEMAKAVLVIWSKSSVQSRFVCDEADEALHDNKLVAVRTSDLGIREIPLGFRQVHAQDIADISRVFDKFETLGLPSGRRFQNAEAELEATDTPKSNKILEEQKLWWKPVTEMVFDDPKQKSPTYRYRNNVRTPFSGSGIWITGFRSKTPPECGVFLGGRSSELEEYRKFIIDTKFEISDLPEGTEFRLHTTDRILFITAKPITHFRNDDEMRSWINCTLNEYVNSASLQFLKIIF